MAYNGLIVDSSVWISYFDEDDSQHKQAKKVLNGLSVSLFIPEYVLLEVVTVLRQKNREGELQQFILTATRDGVYLPAGNLGVIVSGMYANKKYRKLSFVDVGLLLLSRHYQIITFDKALMQAIDNQK